jgi:L-serine deaminase
MAKRLSALSVATFFAQIGPIGNLDKHNAWISGADVGCQDEVGVAYAMHGRIQ